MERILRGVARFSDLGFTKSRMAFRLWVSAESETSAQTGRPIADVIFFVAGILVSGHFPEFLFYGIPASVFELATGWGEKDNRPICTADANGFWILHVETEEVRRRRRAQMCTR